MALPATEDFATANDPLTGSSDWSQPGATSDSGKAASGAYKDESGDTDDKSAYWATDSFNADQYSQITISTDDSGGNHRLGLILRAGSGNEAYLVRFRFASADRDFEAYYWDSGGTRNSIGTAHTPSASVGVNDIIRVEISSDTLTLKVDYGAGFITETTWTEAAGPNSGSAGIYIVDSGVSIDGDDWEGGNLAGAGTTVTPGVESLEVTGFAPTVLASNPITLTPSTESVSITGLAPTIVTPVSVTPGTESVTIQGLAPTVLASENITLTPTTEAITVQGFAPTVQAGANITVEPITESLTVTGYVPIVQTGNSITVEPLAEVINISGFAPTVSASANVTLTPSAEVIEIQGFLPDIVVGGNITVTPPAEVIEIVGYLPTVAVSAATIGGTYNIAGYFPTGQVDVTIALYHPVTGDSVTLSDNTCTEIGSTGIYIWDVSNLSTQPTTYQEYAWVMNDGVSSLAGVKNYNPINIDEVNYTEEFIVHSEWYN